MAVKSKRKYAALGAAAIGIFVVVLLGAQVINHLKEVKTDTKEGLAYLKQAETADIFTIGHKIRMLEEKESFEGSDDGFYAKNYKIIFENCVIMGDSISEGLTEYDYLNASSVVAKIGAKLDGLTDQIDMIKKLNPGIIFLSYGMNDIKAGENSEEFVRQYDKLLDVLKENFPDSKLFVNSIFPVRDDVARGNPEFANLSGYNEKLQKLCDKSKIAFIDNTGLVSDEFYEEDGIHFKPDFYPYWLDQMAEMAALW